ncbi:uncharacterized protein LOC120355224 [Nilaparvata lugens]|uniref:uncharacterized protein LOC120355224 n=1 Tax=Nilaparvata lugens TaxID=108931 RepID=UPI00193D6345|nr:uncharacterized protein LOC120355224 [Nilaparvata lugens]
MDFQKKITRNSKLAICPECSQQFILKDYLKKKKQPLLIGCGHSACESCIRSAVTAKRDIVCKFCGFTKPFEPEMADDLQNFFPIDQFTVGRLIRGSSIGIYNSVELRKNFKKTQASTKSKYSPILPIFSLSLNTIPQTLRVGFRAWESPGRK